MARLILDDRHRAGRAAFVRSVLDTIPIEVYDVPVAQAHALLLAHTRAAGAARGAHDLMIAATAVARDRMVVSADTAAFADLPGVPVRS